MIRKLLFALFLMTYLVAAFSALKSTDPLLEGGNKLLINLPGDSSVTAAYRISQSGEINLPEVGTINLKGLSLSQAQKKIRQALERYFKNGNQTQLTLKSDDIYIQVLGFVQKPGNYLIQKNSNIQIAINQAGGLRAGAQMDRIKLTHKGKTQIVDYRKYLNTGNLSLLPVLGAGDTLFIPISQLLGNVEVDSQFLPTVNKGDASDLSQSIKVFGEVHKPGAYQYDKSMNALDYLLKAGGVTRYAGVDQIRVIDGNNPYPFNLKQYLDTGENKYMPEVKPGATIFIPQRSEEVLSGSRTIYVMGQVQKPGAYEISKTASFMEVLANAGGPNRYADTRKIRVLKPGGKVSEFDMQSYTEGLGKHKLPFVKAGDAIFLPMKTDLNEKSWLDIAPKKAVRIIGSVVRPGRYEWSDEMNLLDLLSHAGGPDKRADLAHIKVMPKQAGSEKAVNFNLTRFIDEGGVETLPKVSAGTTVYVPELPESPHDNKSIWTRQATENSIYVFGEVNKPGRYNFNKQLNFLDILSAADGPKENADLHDIHVLDRQGVYPRVEHVNLKLYFDTGDNRLLPHVLPGDAVFVPSVSRDFNDVPSRHVVKVLGEVKNQGRLRFDSSMTILDLLTAAGGPTAQGLVSRITVISMRSNSKPHSVRFNLINFSKTGDIRTLPAISEGDVIYVPHNNEDFRKQLSDLLRDLTNIAVLARFA